MSAGADRVRATGSPLVPGQFATSAGSFRARIAWPEPVALYLWDLRLSQRAALAGVSSHLQCAGLLSSWDRSFRRNGAAVDPISKHDRDTACVARVRPFHT